MSTNKNSSGRRQQGQGGKGKPSGSFKPNSKRFTKRPADATNEEGAKSFAKKKPFNKTKPTGNAPKNRVVTVASKQTGIRLNKYISNAGICSRRDADTYIETGSATVNGKVITEMGYRVQPTDEVRFDNVLINPETKRYVLLNKPKNYITTMEDERGRKTVMDLVSKACKERIYPVGRLDRDTTGLLLFTNDGELAKKLTHPKHNKRKLYHATLDHKVSLKDLQSISEGPIIDDKKVFVDDVAYVQGQSKNEVGIEIHSGRNRIVRKIFAHFGYKVVKLDRVIFAGLTKKDLPRGHYRHLTEQEVINLNNA
ncbi:pseudouridine synthase [Wenyingzhuangia fucanilytica]|uniref:Pseudouridine synthase n=1 Tax=Wenyingzhuangia fucanilytica TaxID=1790137 RepID=A0A1B1Y7M4_9FLAO|nr:pseudouridine synthase [Wenyingzhuangia fucanilytica]ANW96780.1 pseudouridine synthase [Wenyingzhuangia fucanilytica]